MCDSSTLSPLCVISPADMAAMNDRSAYAIGLRRFVHHSNTRSFPYRPAHVEIVFSHFGGSQYMRVTLYRSLFGTPEHHNLRVYALTKLGPRASRGVEAAS